MPNRNPKITYLTIFLTASLASISANAADLYRQSAPPPAYAAAPAPYVPVNSWAGFYAGINGGYGWSGSGNTIGYSGGGIDGDTTGRAQPQGGFGGGQLGYNFQSGSFVYGVETDFQGGDISDRVTGVSAAGNDFTNRERIDWFGTARGRLGFALGNALLYGTGGFAYGDVRQRAIDNSTLLASSGTQTGWVAGGGVEFKLSPSWSLKGEYQYIDLGNEKLSDPTGASGTNALDTNFHTMRLGLNYRFGGGAEPLK